jgi:hypothetical protein
MRYLMLILAAVLASCVSLPPPSPPPTAQSYPDRGAQSLRLKVGMTEAEVVAIAGEPTSAEVITCGQNTNAPWTCKIWHYGRLEVVFHSVSGKDWTVSSWNFS